MKTTILIMNILLMLNATFYLNARPLHHTRTDIEQIKKDRPKVLVLIIASEDLPVYSELQKIWRSYMHNDPEHIEAYFIKGDPDLSSLCEINGDIIWSRTPESLAPGILNKTILSLEAFLPRIQQEFDYILRTNLSSFYVFPRLLNFLKTCPKKNFYCGSDIGPNCFIGSGCGFLISPDIAELLVQHKDHFINNTTPDDVAIGEFLKQQGIPLSLHTRINFLNLQEWHRQKKNLNAFHFRIKNPCNLRLSDDIYIQTQLLNIFYPRKD